MYKFCNSSFGIDVRSRYFISLVFLFLYRSFVAWGRPFLILQCLSFSNHSLLACRVMFASKKTFIPWCFKSWSCSYSNFRRLRWSLFNFWLSVSVPNLSVWSFQFTLLLYSYIHTFYRHQEFVARMQKVMFEKIQRTLRAVAMDWRSKSSSSPSHAVDQVVAIRSAESEVWEDSKESTCSSIGLQIKIIFNIIAESCCK